MKVEPGDVYVGDHRVGEVLEVANGTARLQWQVKSQGRRGSMSEQRLTKEFQRLPREDEPNWRDLAQRLATELVRQTTLFDPAPDPALLAECRAVGLDVRGEE